MMIKPIGYSVTVQDCYLRRITSPPVEDFPVGPTAGQVHIVAGVTYQAQVLPGSQIAIVDWIAQPEPTTPEEITNRIGALSTEIDRLKSLR